MFSYHICKIIPWFYALSFLWICFMAKLFVRHFVSWWFLPRNWSPCPLTASMPCLVTYRLPFSKRVFIGIFSLVVCLRASYHHIRLAYSNKYRVSLVLFPRKTEHSLMCTIGRIDYGLKIVYSFRPDTPPHYHLHAELLISIEHIGENIEESVNAYWLYFYRI